MHRSRALIDTAAISHNCGVLLRAAGPGTRLCAVVKANGYGHGAEVAAEAAVAGGATHLAVAAAVEALELRRLGRAEPILVMGAVSGEELDALVGAGCDVALWSREALDRAARAAADLDGQAAIHVKFDSGMGRLGTRDRELALGLVDRGSSVGSVQIAGLMTHFATADDHDDGGFLGSQLAAFTDFVSAAREIAPEASAHAANSAATLREPAASFDMVRCGIGIYGLDPFGEDAKSHGLKPALEWTSSIAAVKPIASGESVGYGRRHIATEPGLIATVPVGYADGYRRTLTNAAEAIVNGRTVPVVGTVSMDNITLDLGAGATDQVGDEVVLIGSRGSAAVSAEDLARQAGTINYEIATGISGRTVRSTAGSP